MKIYKIEGFGIPGDKAYVEAASKLEALDKLETELRRLDYDPGRPPLKWECEELARPLNVVLFWRD